VSRLLIVDDDLGVATAIRVLFEHAGYEVAHVTDGRAALRAVHAEEPDVIILDIALPAMDGWTVLERLRDLSDVPVLILSVRRRQMDKVRALRAGADDYVTKPFQNAELQARVEALLRRAPIQKADTGHVYDDGTLFVDPVRREVRVDGAEVGVTPTEFRLLSDLSAHAGAVRTAEQLLAAAWDDASGYHPERVKFAIMRLRRKLGWTEPGASPLATVRGFGYRYVPPL